MNKDILEYTKDIILDQLGISPTTFGMASNKKSYTLRYEGNLRLKKIYDWLYKDAEYYLPRKKNKFDILFNRS